MNNKRRLELNWFYQIINTVPLRIYKSAKITNNCFSSKIIENENDISKPTSSFEDWIEQMIFNRKTEAENLNPRQKLIIQ